MKDNIFENPKILNWKQRIDNSGTRINDLTVIGSIVRNDTDYFGILLDCNILTPEGLNVPRCVLILGDSVVILPLLKCVDDGEYYTLMVEQRRIVDGEYALEFPSGCIDLQENNPKITACQELKEELQLNVSPDELMLLNDSPIKANPSFCGDIAYFYYFVRDVSQTFLEELDGRSTGNHEDKEFIIVRVVKMSNVVGASTLSALIGIKLLERKLNQVF